MSNGMKIDIARTREMVQSVNCLLCKHEDPSSVHDSVCNPSMGGGAGTNRSSELASQVV